MKIDKSQLKVEKYNKSDWSEVLSFYFKNERPTKSIELDWAYNNNPQGEGTFYVLRYKGEIIATRAFLPMCFINRDKCIYTFKSENVYLSEKYRKLGLFRDFTNDIIRGFNKIIWGATLEYKIYSRLNQSHTIRIKNATFAAGSYYGIAKNNINTSKKALLLLSKLRGIIKPGNYNFEINLGYDEACEKLFKTVVSLSDIYLPLINAANVNWKITQNPYIDKGEILSLYHNNKVIAFAVVGLQGDSGVIYDLVFEPNLPGNKKQDCISDVLLYLSENNAIVVNTWLFDNNETNKKTARLMKKSGFIAPKKGMYLGNNFGDYGLDTDDFHFSKWMSLD